MRYLFATENENRQPKEAAAQDVFCAAEASESLTARKAQEESELLGTVQRTLPKWLLIVESVAFLIACPFFIYLLPGRLSWAERYHNAPALVWIGGAALLVWLACFLYKKIQLRRLAGDETLGRDLESTEQSLRSYLGIPEETESIDVLSFACRPDKGRLHFQGRASNCELELFRQGDALCLYDGLKLYALPLEGASLHVLDIGVPVDGSTWNKEDRPDSKRYRDCGVTVYKTEQNGLSFCCALELLRDGERYRLLFPAYELAHVKGLTGLPAPKLPKQGKEKARVQLEKSEDFALDSGPVRPHYYWRVPKGAGEYFSPSSDVEFHAAHPVLYWVLVAVGLTVLLLPAVLFGIAGFAKPGNDNNGWVLLGAVGGFIAGCGLFNLVAAWLDQYLGHIVTLLCLLIGGGLMAFTWFFLL